MKNYLLLAAIICLLSPVTKAQSVTWNDPFPANSHYGRNNLTINDIDGSPYLDAEYKVGTVLTDDGTLYKDIPLRYNCFDDVLEFEKDDSPYDLLPKTKIKRAEFGNQVFTYKDIESNNGSEKSFLQVLAEGKATLFARFGVKFYEAEELKGFADAKPARFDDFSETFYVSVNDVPAKKIINNKKLVEILGDKKKEVESYISKQKISIKKVDDLKKLVAYYNSL